MPDYTRDPTQLHLLFWWKPVSRNLEMQFLKSQTLVDHLKWWLQEAKIFMKFV